MVKNIPDIGETFDFLKLLSSLKLEKKMGSTHIRACKLNKKHMVNLHILDQA